MASTGFLDLMENFYGVEETEEEEVLADTSSFAEFVSAVRKEKARDKDSELVSKSKVDVEDEEIDIDDEEDSDDESVASTASEKPKTLKQKKVKFLLNILTNFHGKRLNYCSQHLKRQCMIQVFQENI